MALTWFWWAVTSVMILIGRTDLAIFVAVWACYLELDGINKRLKP